MRMLPLLALSLLLLPIALRAQDTPAAPRTLQEKVAAIAGTADATVAVACGLSSGTIDCDLKPDNHPPMQSVFKLPLAMTVLHEVEQGRFRLDQPIRFLASDLIQPKPYSPLQDAHPQANVDIPLRDLLQGAVSVSDNTAADILLRIIGGPSVVQTYIPSIGIQDFQLMDGERALHADEQMQFRNWISPRAAVKLLLDLGTHSPLNAEHTSLLFAWMSTTRLAGRIQAGLPPGTVLRHKTGTSDMVLGLAYATNDIGLITLPDGRLLAVAIFLTNSTDKTEERDATIAKIAKAAYDAAVHP